MGARLKEFHRTYIHTIEFLIRYLCVAGGRTWHFEFHSLCSPSPTILQCHKSQLFTNSYQTNWITRAWCLYAGCNDWQFYSKRQGWAFEIQMFVHVIGM